MVVGRVGWEWGWGWGWGVGAGLWRCRMVFLFVMHAVLASAHTLSRPLIRIQPLGCLLPCCPSPDWHLDSQGTLRQRQRRYHLHPGSHVPPCMGHHRQGERRRCMCQHAFGSFIRHRYPAFGTLVLPMLASPKPAHPRLRHPHTFAEGRRRLLVGTLVRARVLAAHCKRQGRGAPAGEAAGVRLGVLWCAVRVVVWGAAGSACWGVPVVMPLLFPLPSLNVPDCPTPPNHRAMAA